LISKREEKLQNRPLLLLTNIEGLEKLNIGSNCTVLLFVILVLHSEGGWKRVPVS